MTPVREEKRKEGSIIPANVPELKQLGAPCFPMCMGWRQERTAAFFASMRNRRKKNPCSPSFHTIPWSLICTGQQLCRSTAMIYLLEDPSHPFILQACLWPKQQWKLACATLCRICFLSSERLFPQVKTPFEGMRRSAGHSPRLGGFRAARCADCWRSSSPESPPGACGPAGRAAAPPPTPARRHQMVLPRGLSHRKQLSPPAH